MFFFPCRSLEEELIFPLMSNSKSVVCRSGHVKQFFIQQMKHLCVTHEVKLNAAESTQRTCKIGSRHTLYVQGSNSTCTVLQVTKEEEKKKKCSNTLLVEELIQVVQFP